MGKHGPVENRFFDSFDTSEDCWLWTGSLDSYGYGRISERGQWKKAHRLALVFHGENVEGHLVLHKCRNRHCVRPSHLYLGNPKQNAGDMKTDGTNFFSNKTHCLRGHPLSGENLFVHKKTGSRSCRICRRAAVNAAYARKNQGG